MERLDWEELLSLESPWAYFVACSESDLDNFALRRQTFSAQGEVVRSIRGKRCSTNAALLQEWAAAFQFPSYFGENWDAFVDCMCDLAWVRAPAYVSFVTGAHHVLANQPDQVDTFIDVLKGCSEEWQSAGSRAIGKAKPTPFKVVFHSGRSEFADRLADVGVVAASREVPRS
jgi:RNAse (barnase) inhibitor barstar